MTSIFPPFNRRTSFRKQPYFFEAGRGVNSKGLAGPIPALSLTFTSGALDPRVTFSRPSLATYFDSTGKLTYAPNNLALQSEDFGSASWTKSQATVSTNTEVAPNGTTTADTLLDTAVSNIHYANQSITTHSPAGKIFIVSVYAKAATLNYVTVGLTDISVGDRYAVAVFNLSNGTLSTSGASGTGYAVSSPIITSVGSGWFRCSVVCTVGATAPFLTTAVGVNKTGVITAAAGGMESYLGNGSGIYVWGAQLEAVTYQTTPSTYVATTASAYYGPRFEYDPVTLVPRGLLIEEAMAANLLTYSEDFSNAAWSTRVGLAATPFISDTAVSPDGRQTADKMVENSANSAHYVARTGATIGVQQTFSVYAKAAERSQIALQLGAFSAYYDLLSGTVVSGSGASIQSVGSGWYRCSLTATPASADVLIYLAVSGSVTYLGNGTSGVLLWGAQLEARAFATSYLPTGASTAARSADVVSMTGTNFSSWFSATQGTFVVQADIIAANAAKSATLVGAPTSSYLPLYLTAATAPLGRTWDGTNIATTANPASTGGAFKITNAYRSDGLAVCLNAGTVASNSYNGAFSSMTSVYFGSGNTGTDLFLNGHIASIQFYTSRLSNDQLQALTQPSLEASMFLTFDTSSDSFVDASWGP